MGIIRNWLRQARGRLTGVGRTGRLVLLAMVGLIMAGGTWLICSAPSPPMHAVFDEPLAPTDLTSAEKVLEERGITYRSEGGRLYVSGGSAKDAKTILTLKAPPTGSAVDSFEKLASGGDLWETRAQNAKRWQAAKMGVLSRQVSQFTSVQSATARSKSPLSS